MQIIKQRIGGAVVFKQFRHSNDYLEGIVLDVEDRVDFISGRKYLKYTLKDENGKIHTLSGERVMLDPEIEQLFEL